MNATNLDLDVATPEDLVKVLRNAAERFYESEGELQADWSDPNAGRVWRELAKIMERAANSAERAIEKFT